MTRTSMWSNAETGSGTFLLGSFGVGLMLVGSCVFVGQVIVWVARHTWPSVTMASLFGPVWLMLISPLVGPWVGSHRRALNEGVLAALDFLPLSLSFFVVGALLVRRAARGRR